jgi:hypothetical protein
MCLTSLVERRRSFEQTTVGLWSYARAVPRERRSSAPSAPLRSLGSSALGASVRFLPCRTNRSEVPFIGAAASTEHVELRQRCTQPAIPVSDVVGVASVELGHRIQLGMAQPRGVRA